MENNVVRHSTLGTAIENPGSSPSGNCHGFGYFCELNCDVQCGIAYADDEDVLAFVAFVISVLVSVDAAAFEVFDP